MIINHLGCGMRTFKEQDLAERLQRHTGKAAVAPDRFYAFEDSRQNVHRQVQKLRDHPWIPDDIPIRCFVYDEHTGRLTEVEAERAASRPSEASRAA